MEIVRQTLQNPVGLLFTVIALGLLIGRIPLGKIKLGGSGVLIAGLVFGHFGFLVPKTIQTVGVVLFVYSVGLRAGPYFMNSLKKSKGSFLIMAGLIVSSACLLAVILKHLFGISPQMITGLFAGALTSTPALAAAMEAVGDSTPSIGYGLAYPLGILGVILLVQLLPTILKVDLKKEDEKYRESLNTSHIVRKSFKVTNPNITGKPLRESFSFAKDHFRIVRIKRGDRIMTLHADQALEQHDIVLVVGRDKDLTQLKVVIGDELSFEVPESDEAKSRWITVSSKKFAGRKLGHLEIGTFYGVIVTRVRRSGVEFVPNSNFVLEAGDEVRASGLPEDLQLFREIVGRDKETLNETDIFSFAVGLTFGVLLGLVKIPIGNNLFISFGVAGGPLIVGLLFGFFGRFGKLTGYMPKAANLLIGELGLYLFLAVAGCAAGENFVEVLRDQGLILIVSGLLVTVFPILVAAVVGHYVFRINLLILLGMICGGMTSTPALGVIASNTKSDIPALGYTGIYPLAVLLTTLAAQILAAF